MGCFSYMCKKCNTPINASERCVLFFMHNGKIVEMQNGTYDNYGSVDELEDVNATFSGDYWKYKGWSELIDLHFDKDNNTGFSCYHEQCYDGQTPRTISDDDRNQGWGKSRDKFSIKKEIKLPLTIIKDLIYLNGVKK